MCFLEESYEKDAENSNFESFKSTLYSKSGSMPLSVLLSCIMSV